MNGPLNRQLVEFQDSIAEGGVRCWRRLIEADEDSMIRMILHFVTQLFDLVTLEHSIAISVKASPAESRFPMRTPLCQELREFGVLFRFGLGALRSPTSHQHLLNFGGVTK